MHLIKHKAQFKYLRLRKDGIFGPKIVFQTALVCHLKGDFNAQQSRSLSGEQSDDVNSHALILNFAAWIYDANPRPTGSLIVTPVNGRWRHHRKPNFDDQNEHQWLSRLDKKKRVAINFYDVCSKPQE